MMVFLVPFSRIPRNGEDQSARSVAVCERRGAEVALRMTISYWNAVAQSKSQWVEGELSFVSVRLAMLLSPEKEC
jgi:hypothetical protein